MRLNELNLDGYRELRKTKWDMPVEILEWFDEHGFELLGGGTAARAYADPSDKFIVRLSYQRSDDNYIQYSEYCRKNKNDPHLPKMGKVKKYEGFFIIFVEKLEYLDDEIAKIINRYFRAIWDHSHDEEWLLINMHLNSDNRDDPEWLKIRAENNMEAALRKRLLEIEPDRNFVESIIKQLPSLVKTADRITKNVSEVNDIGPGNIMLRGDTLVLNDPIY